MSNPEEKIVEIYTDGSCIGNPGPGGWGAVLRSQGKEKRLSGADPETTNNRMELTAAIKALEALKQPCIVHITTDSQYVKNGITKWITNWKRNNWRTSDKKPVKNKELWQALEAAIARHEMHWHWIRGHNGHPENELADYLARNAAEQELR